MGTLQILNVGVGDIRVSFDRANPAETIRAQRIVKDMLRRGYALLVEIERNGEKAFERAIDFREDTNEYIIADFDPNQAEKADAVEHDHECGKGVDDGPKIKAEKNTAENDRSGDQSSNGAKRGRRRGVPADSTRAVAVARSAGG